jgi:hypothetical protein
MTDWKVDFEMQTATHTSGAVVRFKPDFARGRADGVLVKVPRGFNYEDESKLLWEASKVYFEQLGSQNS